MNRLEARYAAVGMPQKCWQIWRDEEDTDKATAPVANRPMSEAEKGSDFAGAGSIWHTQGSGKSLTMVMLGRSLALDKDIFNPRIVIVTDRDDNDKQIKGALMGGWPRNTQISAHPKTVADGQ